MTYLTYLKSKSKLLVIWFIINGFALFVNVFDINGKINIKDTRSEISNIHLFTVGSWEDKQDNFWPIAEYFSERNSWWGGNVKSFNGIFYGYDISEFIAYNLLVFIILYFRYESRKSTVMNQNN